MKQCTVCKESKTLRLFYKHPNTLDGRGSRCKECEAKEKRRICNENKKRLVAEFGGACTRCGYDKCIAALDFHHLYDKKFQVTGSHRTYSKLLEEAKKCVLICANCHREEHYNALYVSTGVDGSL